MDNDGTVDVALTAGEAAAEAKHAAEEAAEAVETAEAAEETAEAAAEAAARANENAWNAQDAVAGLRSDMEAGFARMEAMIAGSLGGPADDTPPAPPRKEPEPEAEAKKDDDGSPDSAPSTDDKPRKYGSKSWFGGS